MNYIIVTGSSRGLGKSIVKGLLKDNNHIFCISRRENRELMDLARKNNISLDYFVFDLNDYDNIDGVMDKIFDKIDKEKASSISLINNAGIVAPIKPISKCNTEEIAKNINVNLIAPMAMTAAFMRLTEDLKIRRRVINISSGAGKRPIFGWGSYCTSKAGIDMFTKCIGVEEDSKEFPVEVISFGPGIMDTGLQEEIRSSKKEDFIQLDTFVGFKEEGKLAHPDTVAEVVINILNDQSFEQGGVVDVKDFK